MHGVAGRYWHVAELGQSVPPSLQPLGWEAHPPGVLTRPWGHAGRRQPWAACPVGSSAGSSAHVEASGRGKGTVRWGTDCPHDRLAALSPWFPGGCDISSELLFRVGSKVGSALHTPAKAPFGCTISVFLVPLSSVNQNSQRGLGGCTGGQSQAEVAWPWPVWLGCLGIVPCTQRSQV